MKLAVLSFVPLGKGDAAHFAAGGPGGTPGATRPLSLTVKAYHLKPSPPPGRGFSGEDQT